MTDQEPDGATDNAPMAVKKTPRERGFSPIWIIPIVALLIGLFLVYRVISETGPTIFISFQAASGIEAGKTKVKFKEVEVGEVTDVDIDSDLAGVTADIRGQYHRTGHPAIGQLHRHGPFQRRQKNQGFYRAGAPTGYPLG
jgi:paraquat-inducible protein B